ncbi:MAG TPA: glycerol-3-phosphate 1-O-acyltransferase PlsY [Hyphomicrobiaceae bacterium]|nr:glycerol-3-phosphate 1-O-acyltransferase PlsY [Hyphomicrobiaceae bacterium]
MGILSWSMLVVLAFGYLLGSIPFGLLLTKAAGLGDVRSIGSGNIGATNVLRTGNKKLAALTLALDALKGAAAVLIGRWIFLLLLTGQTDPIPSTGHGEDNLNALPVLVAGLGAFLGHLYPVWLGFKGGKGVATYIGVLLGADWRLALAFCAIWLLVAFATRYSSLSALVAAIAAPVIAWFMGSPVFLVLTAIMSALLVWKHRTNIRRLVAGEEPKIGAKGKS